MKDFAAFALIHLSVIELPNELQTMMFIEREDRIYMTISVDQAQWNTNIAREISGLIARKRPVFVQCETNL